MKDYRPIDDVGVAKGTAFQEIRPCAGFKTGDFVKEKLGGATVVRLLYRSTRPKSTWTKAAVRRALLEPITSGENSPDSRLCLQL